LNKNKDFELAPAIRIKTYLVLLSYRTSFALNIIHPKPNKMKKFFFLSSAVLMLASCNQKTEDAAVKSASTEEKVEYAYTIEKPDNWLPGSKKNTQIVLQSLKDFETGNIDACAAAYADTCMVKSDMVETLMTRDSLKNWFSGFRSELKEYEVKVSDWESVVSLDGQTEYVSIWFTEKWTDQKGKVDSISAMEDYKMKDGKIVEFDRKTRKLAAKKP
jgi:hypothetical protein